MRLVLDSDVLVHALRMPKREDLYALHKKASNIFESCIEQGLKKMKMTIGYRDGKTREK